MTVSARLIVNTAEAAIDAAKEGLGIVRVLSYRAEQSLAGGTRFRILEEFEPEPIPGQPGPPRGAAASAQGRELHRVCSPAAQAGSQGDGQLGTFWIGAAFAFPKRQQAAKGGRQPKDPWLRLEAQPFRR